jgi:hypothetical protein
MADEEIAQPKQGVALSPMTAGSVVLSYNLPDVTKPLKLSRAAYLKIFQGEITNWNDPLIAKTNEGVSKNSPIDGNENEPAVISAPNPGLGSRASARRRFLRFGSKELEDRFAAGRPAFGSKAHKQLPALRRDC